jgi:hypothetical protein
MGPPTHSQPTGERGAVLVIVAVWLPVLVLMATFVIDVANWFVHKRHLQMQADAAALAAAADWGHPGCLDTAIEARAREYGGWGHNAQIGGTPASKVHFVMNSRTYPGQATPVDNTVDTRPPCQAAMVDVKLTETDLPWFLQAAKFVPFINAHARVSILQAETLAGALPVGVPDPRPERAQVIFVDENDCASGVCRELGRRDLAIAGTSSTTWDNSANPFPLTVASSRIGVRVALTATSSGPLDCGAPLVDCFDAGSATGILRIRGWEDPGTVLPTQDPKVRDVRILNGTCTGPYFSTATAGCSVAVEADIDFGSTDPPTELRAAVSASVGGNQRYSLTYDAASGLWRSSAVVPVAAGAGPVSVTLHWEKRLGSSDIGPCSNSAPCTGSFADVHRTFAGSSARTGPILGARVYETTDPLLDANSFQMCATCTHDVVVQLDLTPSLEYASAVSDPPVVLRLTGSGSLTQALDCDPGKSRLEDEIATGCEPSYRPNTGTLCPEHNVLWGTAQPWECVKVDTGAPPNKVAAGLNLRILGAEKPTICSSPSNWANFPAIPRGDPRIVQVFLTKFGSFAGSGMGTEPVTGFATFYVTGWRGSGGGFANPCVGQGDDETPGDGYIIGHFIRYVSTINTGTGTQPCSPNTFGTCIAVMTE